MNLIVLQNVGERVMYDLSKKKKKIKERQKEQQHYPIALKDPDYGGRCGVRNLTYVLKNTDDVLGKTERNLKKKKKEKGKTDSVPGSWILQCRVLVEKRKTIFPESWEGRVLNVYAIMKERPLPALIFELYKLLL